MRLLICAGGTGGGVYPALAVLQSLKEEPKPGFTDDDVLWVGGKEGMEKDIVSRKDIPFSGIPAAGLHGVALQALPGNFARLARGFFEARKIIRSFDPDVMFFTGGYVAAPVALAGWRVPSVLFVPDIEPGLALKSLARLADAIAVTTEKSVEFFSPGKDVHVTGYPVRPELTHWSRDKAYQELQLEEKGPVLLVFGGSKGARSINRALVTHLRELLEEMQIVHISGQLDWQEVKAAGEGLPSRLRERYRPFPYLHGRMGAALSAADLVLSRAGASVLGEFPLFELPAILVPYPHAWRYQRVNARYLADRGAAVILEDEDLPKGLLPQVLDLMQDESRRKDMGEQMGALAEPQAAETIARVVVETGQKKGVQR